MYIKKLKTLNVINEDKLNLYIEFCLLKNRNKKYSNTEAHHILPKSLFPEYSNLEDNSWNCAHLKYEDHYIAHSILAEAIDNDKIIYAWNSMNSINTKSKNIKPIGIDRYILLRERHRKIVSAGQIKRNKNPEIINKRKETLSVKKENGLTGFQENGIKISKALKGKVSILNIKNNIKFRGVQQEDYDNCWYLVGHTAKYITLYEIDGILYTEKGLNIDKNILLKDYFKIRKNKPFKNIKLSIEEVHNNFEYYSSIISTNS